MKMLIEDDAELATSGGRYYTYIAIMMNFKVSNYRHYRHGVRYDTLTIYAASNPEYPTTNTIYTVISKTHIPVIFNRSTALVVSIRKPSFSKEKNVN